MRILIILAVLVYGLAATPAAAAACGPRAALLDMLWKRHGERLVAVAMAGNSRIEMTMAPDGQWTLLVTLPRQRTCAVASGTDWEWLPEPQMPPAREKRS